MPLIYFCCYFHHIVPVSPFYHEFYIHDILQSIKVLWKRREIAWKCMKILLKMSWGRLYRALHASCAMVTHKARATNGVETSVEFCPCFVRQHRLKGTPTSWDILSSDALCLYWVHVLYFKRWCCSNGPSYLWKAMELLGREKVSHSGYWVESFMSL